MTITHPPEKLAADIDLFVAERHWRQFHAPKNPAMALSVEVAELVEKFQWLTAEQNNKGPKGYQLSARVPFKQMRRHEIIQEK